MRKSLNTPRRSLKTRESDEEEVRIARATAFDIDWERKLAKRAMKRAEHERLRRETCEEKLIEQSESNARLRWEIARVRVALRKQGLMTRSDRCDDDDDGDEMVSEAIYDDDDDEEEEEDIGEENLSVLLIRADDEKDNTSEEKEEENVEQIEIGADGSREGRDRRVVLAFDGAFESTRNNSGEEDGFFFSPPETAAIAEQQGEIKKEVKSGNITEAVDECEENVISISYEDIDDDARALFGGEDALEIEPMRSSDCTRHVLLLMCELVRFLRIDSSMMPTNDCEIINEYTEHTLGDSRTSSSSSVVGSSFTSPSTDGTPSEPWSRHTSVVNAGSHNMRSSRLNSTAHLQQQHQQKRSSVYHMFGNNNINNSNNSNNNSNNRRVSTIYDSKASIGARNGNKSTFFRNQAEQSATLLSPSVQIDLLRFVRSWFITSHGSHELATWHLRAFAVTLRRLRRNNNNNLKGTTTFGYTALARVFSRLIGCCQPLARDERRFVMIAFCAMLPPDKSAKNVPLCKKNQTPLVFLDEAERGIKYAFRRNKIPLHLQKALQNHRVSSDCYTFQQDLQQQQQHCSSSTSEDRYAIDIGIALDLALTELVQLKKSSRLKFSEAFDATIQYRSKPLMHRPIVRTLLKEAGASGEEADALAAEVFESCHEETKRMMLRQRGIGLSTTAIKGNAVSSSSSSLLHEDIIEQHYREHVFEMGILSKVVFAKCASEIMPGICLLDIVEDDEIEMELNNRSSFLQAPSHSMIIEDTSLPQNNSAQTQSSGSNGQSRSANIEVCLSLDTLAYAWNKTEAFIDKTLTARAEQTFIAKKPFAIFKAQPSDPKKRQDVDELFERAEKLRRTMTYALRAAQALSKRSSQSNQHHQSSSSSCDENVKTAWDTYCGATCAFERAVQAQRSALGVEQLGSFWF